MLLKSTISIFRARDGESLELSYVSGGISAGFPSPALDFEDLKIDLNRHLIKNPSATFYGKVRGESLRDAGISDGDLLVIDRSIEPKDGKIAVCFLDGEFTAKRIKKTKNELWLLPENSDYQPIQVGHDNDFIVWGIVTYVIKSF